MSTEKKSLLKKIIAIILGFGPGIFAIGYTIGTGSVTSMIVAGSTYGMQLLWVLLLSCLFSGVLMFAYGNYALISGETALYGLNFLQSVTQVIFMFILKEFWLKLLQTCLIYLQKQFKCHYLAETDANYISLIYVLTSTLP